MASALALLLLWVVAMQVADPGAVSELPSQCQSVEPSLGVETSASQLSDASAYDAVFTGDATGATDVTDDLMAFLETHDDQHVALAEDGIYQVTSVKFSASDLTVDFRGARLVASLPGVSGILRLATGSEIVLNDPFVIGTGYAWEATLGDPADNLDALQNEHGIHIDGGSGITVNRPVTRDTRGDGIYVGYQSGKNLPASRVLINDPDIERASRNGIAPVAGQVTIRGGRIIRTGLFGVDFEPNDDTGARSIEGVVRGLDIRQVTDLPGAASHASGPYAVAAGGYSTAAKPSVRVERVTGDRLRMTIRDTAAAVVCGNVSDTATTASFSGVLSLAFGDNVGISKE